MGLVRAKKDVFLNEHGYHRKGEEFSYGGPDNENLESVEAGPYSDYGDAELRAEINRRGLTYVAVATHKDLEAVLLEDDSKADAAKVEPKPRKPKQGPQSETPAAASGQRSEQPPAADPVPAPPGQAGAATGAAAANGSASAVGADATGAPVTKGSATDVTV